jgi:ATP adenylyltransferase
MSENNKCAYCLELETSPRKCILGWDRVIWENDRFIVIPTVGCFVEGYVMIMPKRHTFSMAQLEKDELKELSRLSTQLYYKLKHKYGEIMIAEHGAVSCDIRGAQCCDHAHLHFIPTVTRERLELAAQQYSDVTQYCGNTPEFVGSLSDLQKYNSDAYILFALAPGYYNVWRSSAGFERQFCRRAAALANGMPDLWNWRDHYGEENMIKTYQALKGKLEFTL